MSELAQRVTAEEYLRLDRAAEFKSELIDGQIVMMSGGSRAHSLIAANVVWRLSAQLEARPCEAYGSDVRVLAVASRSYFYPDVSVACGEIQFTDDYPDTLLNPTVVVEVLSASTEGLDRGRKWGEYRRLPSLQHYVLIAQDRVLIDVFVRCGEEWLHHGYADLDDVVDLPAIGCRLRLRDVYYKMPFSASPPASPGE